MTKNKNRPVFPILSVILLAASALGAGNAFALTALKQVQVSNGSRVDLLFDGKVSRSQIKTEFLRNIIQISLTDVSVYPAKISSVSGGDITKIFAYQYAPKLVRCRLTVKGNAEAYKNKLFLSSGGPGGKMLTVRLENGPAGALASSAAIHDADEQALLEKVMKSKDPGNADGASTKAAEKAAAHETNRDTAHDTMDTITVKSAAPARTSESADSASAQNVTNTEDRPLNLNTDDTRGVNHIGGANDFPSPLSALGKLALVIGLFGLVALGFKKFWKPGGAKSATGSQDGPLLGAIGRFARKNLGVRGQKAPIEVLSNHHLGPKKSIAVIRVGGRTMVIGITEQSINLISQLSSEEDTLNALAELDNPPLDDVLNTPAAAPAKATKNGPAVFSKLLQSETTKPAIDTPIVNTPLGRAGATAKTAANAVRRDSRVTSYGSTSAPVSTPASTSVPAGGAEGGVSAQAAIGLSGVRAQIRNKLEGFKQI